MQTYELVPDAELITKYREGQCAAMEALIVRHKDKVFTTIYLLVRDHALAEDIFQECFLKVIRMIQDADSAYAEQGRFLPWVMRMARNMCIDYFRRLKVRRPVSFENPAELENLIGPAPGHAGTALEQREAQHLVREAIARLSEEQREVVSLRIYGELSFKEIAEITGVSINTALGRMRYALINMRRMLQEQETGMEG